MNSSTWNQASTRFFPIITWHSIIWIQVSVLLFKENTWSLYNATGLDKRRGRPLLRLILMLWFRYGTTPIFSLKCFFIKYLWIMQEETPNKDGSSAESQFSGRAHNFYWISADSGMQVTTWILIQPINSVLSSMRGI